MSDAVIQVKDLKKIYKLGIVEVHALDGVTFDIQRGEIIAIMGPSTHKRRLHPGWRRGIAAQ